MSAIDDLNTAVTDATAAINAAVAAIQSGGGTVDDSAIEADVATLNAATDALNAALAGGSGEGAPVVTGLSPSTGSVDGGTPVIVSGSGFTDATGVNFGSLPATSFAVLSDTTIGATSPAFAAGTVDVTVTGPGGTSATSTADQFTAS